MNRSAGRHLARIALVCAPWLASAVHAQTLSAVAAAETSCSTAGGEGLSDQLVDVQRCLHPGQFVLVESPDVTATSARVHLVAQASARDAILAAAAIVPLMINSGFRPVSDQFLLATSGQCSVVAAPGSSNHQSGRAIDVSNTVAARTALEAAGCVWLGASDAVHYDCPGMDLRADSVAAFQRLYNLNGPVTPLTEDGVYGPMTAAALASAPASGYPIGSLTQCTFAADAGVPDAGIADAGSDASLDASSDAASPDAAPVDGGGTDAGPPPSGAPAGCGCRVAAGSRLPATTSLGGIALFLLVVSRKRRPSPPRRVDTV